MVMLKVLLVACLLAGLAAAACPPFSYAGDTAPEHWGSLCPEYDTCSRGNQQSPIDIQTASLVPGELQLDLQYSNEVDLKLVKQPTGLELHYQSAEGVNELRMSELDLFGLERFHFHAPSEHTIDGVHSDMEVHLVHADSFGRYLVLGVMIEAVEGESCAFLDQFPIHEVVHEESQHLMSIDSLRHLLGLDKATSFYSYPGSLTTPPCTEGLKWLVMTHSLHCSPQQVGKLVSVLGTTNRPVQPLNHRSVHHVTAALFPDPIKITLWFLLAAAFIFALVMTVMKRSSIKKKAQ